MRQTVVVYGVIAVYVASERFLRQGVDATSLEEPQTDQGSTRAIGAALGVSTVSLALAPLLNRHHIAVLPKRRLLFPIGVGAMIDGLLVRAWANRVLGTAYTRTLRVVTDQHIVEQGPYRVVRHPGYLGTLLVWLGAALACANGVTLAIASSVLLRAYVRRIETEERMLLDTFGDEYRAYAGRTTRLVPLVY